MLHPCHKLQYFVKAGWEPDWIKAAHAIVHEEFDHTYAFMDVEVDVPALSQVRYIIYSPS